MEAFVWVQANQSHQATPGCVRVTDRALDHRRLTSNNCSAHVALLDLANGVPIDISVHQENIAFTIQSQA